jgi:hypothetical protein
MDYFGRLWTVQRLSHGTNRGSNPLRDAKEIKHLNRDFPGVSNAISNIDWSSTYREEAGVAAPSRLVVPNHPRLGLGDATSSRAWRRVGRGPLQGTFPRV